MCNAQLPTQQKFGGNGALFPASGWRRVEVVNNVTQHQDNTTFTSSVRRPARGKTW